MFIMTTVRDKGDDLKRLNIINFGLIISLTLLMGIQIARSVGVSQPIPVDLKMLRGDTARFYFYISTATLTVKQDCSYSVSGLEPLVINFDEKGVVLDPEVQKNFYGSIYVPDNAPITTYNGQLTVSCKPEGAQGGSIIQQNVVVPFVVNVIEKPEERVINQIPEEKREAFPVPLIVIVIVLILAIIGYYFSKKSEMKKPHDMI